VAPECVQPFCGLYRKLANNPLMTLLVLRSKPATIFQLSDRDSFSITFPNIDL
jgi:hypothetical protein